MKLKLTIKLVSMNCCFILFGMDDVSSRQAVKFAGARLSVDGSSQVYNLGNPFANNVLRQDSQDTIIDVASCGIGPVEKEISDILEKKTVLQLRSKLKNPTHVLAQATLKLANVMDLAHAREVAAEKAQAEINKQARRQAFCNSCINTSISLVGLGLSVFSIVWGIKQG